MMVTTLTPGDASRVKNRWGQFVRFAKLVLASDDLKVMLEIRFNEGAAASALSLTVADALNLANALKLLLSSRVTPLMKLKSRMKNLRAGENFFVLFLGRPVWFQRNLVDEAYCWYFDGCVHVERCDCSDLHGFSSSSAMEVIADFAKKFELDENLTTQVRLP